MNISDVFVIVVVIFAGFFGIIGGLFVGKYIEKKRNQKIESNAQEFLDGKRENTMEIEGIKYDAKKFKVRDDDGTEKTIIDLQGGELKKDGKKESSKKQSNKVKANSNSGKDSKSTRVYSSIGRQKEQTPGSIPRRIRRFG